MRLSSRHDVLFLAVGSVLLSLSCSSGTTEPDFDEVRVRTGTLATGIVGAAYSAVLEASGGDGSYSWVIPAGSLPSGLMLAATGTIGGTPTLAGTSDFTIQALSGDGQSDAREVSISVHDVLVVTTSALVDPATDERNGDFSPRWRPGG